MGLLSKLKQRGRDAKSVFSKSEHIIEWVFNVGGTDYYQFADVFNMSFERGLTAIAIYNELDMRCSRNYLLKHVEAVNSILKQPEIDIFKINALNEQMRQRLQLVTDVELLYRLASVVFFDKKENPNLYEQEYCEKKIAHWKAHKGVADFFLQQPIAELIPFLQNVGIDLDGYTKLNEELNKLHLEKLHSLNSKKE